MKKTPLLLLVLLVAIQAAAQFKEFKEYPNGFIYSETTMGQLNTIVDSLNLKYKVCELDRVYRSEQQAEGHYVYLKEGNIVGAQKDIENGMPFSEWLLKYPQAEVTKNLLIIKYEYENYKGEHTTVFNSLITDQQLRFTNQPELFHKPVYRTWMHQYHEKTEYGSERLKGFFFGSEFKSKPLPETYARMVQYVDCMVDTTETIFREAAQETSYYYTKDDESMVSSFLTYVHRHTQHPDFSMDAVGGTAYWKAYQEWNSQRFVRIDSHLVQKQRFQQLFTAAIDEALKLGNTNEEFEGYIGRYRSKQLALDLKRNRIVVGSCSMDDSPREHARSIAVLSAETVSWEIFLRAHLNIMNDRVSRVSDNSVAWEKRETYLGELEALGIDVLDLLLGSALRVENAHPNHYLGNIQRMGRALSEYSKPEALERRLLTMIRDKELDNYNRVLMYYLFLNYNHYLKDEDRKSANQERLMMALDSFPENIIEHLNASH